MICPKVPDAAIVPVANDGEYLLRIIEGRDISPMATTVAPTMPVVAAKRAPTKTTEIPNPPGTGPNKPAIVINKSSAQSIGYGNLNKMNQTGVQRFAAGGAVQRFANGGSVGSGSGLVVPRFDYLAGKADTVPLNTILI